MKYTCAIALASVLASGLAIATSEALAQGLKPSQSSKMVGKMSSELGQRSAEEISTIDGIVAVVNTDVITRSELNRQVALVERQMSKRGVPLPDRSQLRSQILDRMIMDRAQIQLAKDTGIRVDDSQVEAAMARVAEQNNMSLEDFFKRLVEDGLSPLRFREEIKNEITIARLRERDVESRIQISDAEVQSFLASKKQGVAADVGPEVNWTQLLFKLPQDAAESAVSATMVKAKAAEKALLEGQTSGAIMKNFPELNIPGTGEMGWQSLGNVPTLFAQFLSQKDIASTQIIRSPAGLHVLKINQRRDSSLALDTTPVTQTRARHILIRTGPDVSETEAKRRLTFALEQLKAGQADFETLAKRYSMDGSASKGGDLGWIYPGDTVPEFEREMNQLAPGQVSGVFQSRFGFHIIQVEERRQQAASEERQRQLARQAIRNAKSEDNYQEWLRQLRDKTFVDIRL